MISFHLVPDYLRTKLDLDLESRQKELYSEAGTTSSGLDVSYSTCTVH